MVLITGDWVRYFISKFWISQRTEICEKITEEGIYTTKSSTAKTAVLNKKLSNIFYLSIRIKLGKIVTYYLNEGSKRLFIETTYQQTEGG